MTGPGGPVPPGGPGGPGNVDPNRLPQDPYRYPPPPPAPRIRPLPVIGGFVLGSVGWLGVQVVLLVVFLNQDTAGTRYFTVTAILVALAVALLMFRRTRQAGAGLLLGLAVSTIVWAGLCMAFLGGY